MPDNPLSINPDGNRKSAMVNTAHLKTLQEMDAEEIGEWLTTCGYGDYADKFVAHNVSGDAVPQLASADLKEIGVDKVVSAASNRSAARCRLTQTVAGHQGDRVRLLKDLREFRVAMEIEHRHEILFKWTEFRWFCSPFDTTYYTLTPSYVEIYSEAGCFGSERSSIDISTITDVQLESSGCAGACCYSDITITVVAGEADFVIAVSNREAGKVFDAIKNCWEAFQANRANRTQRL